MAATVSSVWAKPGAWALDSEEHEDELNQEIEFDRQKAHRPEPPVAEFPSLSAAATTTKPKKKNKGQTLSLAEFSNYSSAPKPAIFEPNRLTQHELISLPTGPRERTADELDRSRIGGGFRNYGGGGGGDFSGARVSDRNKEGYNSNSNRERDLGPSRADEVDDWSKTKRSSSFGGGPGPERPERPERRERVGFFNSSRADDVDNWASNKSFSPSSEGPTRERRMGLGFESYSNGSGPDSDNWLKKKEREEENHGNDVGRPRLNLQPRTLPVNNGQTHLLPGTETKPKGANPFGEARPREEVLAEKGKDWKEIDEKLEAVKIKEVGEGLTNKRRGFGISEFGDGDTVKSWRKPESNDAVLPSSAETTDNTETADNVPQGS